MSQSPHPQAVAGGPEHLCVLITYEVDLLPTAPSLFVLCFFRKVKKFCTPHAGSSRKSFFPKGTMYSPLKPFRC